ncbi:MAG: hypothetical protein IPK48_02540 [Gammaproteobacteria bacterium]|nr:hypothetical protein [Gammaproteobacteria bacterium]
MRPFTFSRRRGSSLPPWRLEYALAGLQRREADVERRHIVHLDRAVTPEHP